MKEPKFFAPTNDFVFKLIFGDERNIDILADFLQAVLDLPPEEYADIKVVDTRRRALALSAIPLASNSPASRGLLTPTPNATGKKTSWVFSM